MVLSPGQMAAEITRLSKKADISQLTHKIAESSQEDASNKDLEKILLFVRLAIGVNFGHYKKTTIRRRIIRRMLLYKLERSKNTINPSETTQLKLKHVTMIY